MSAEYNARIMEDFLTFRQDIERNRSQALARTDVRILRAEQENLLRALDDGDLLGMMRAYEKGAMVNVFDPIHGDSPMNVAISRQDVSAFLLLHAFMDTNVNLQGQEGKTALHVACEMQDPFVIGKLLDGKCSLEKAGREQVVDPWVPNAAGEMAMAFLPEAGDEWMEATRRRLARHMETCSRSRLIAHLKKDTQAKPTAWWKIF